MCVVPPPTRLHLRATVVESLLPGIVYLPLYPELPSAALERMVEVVRQTSRTVSPPQAIAVTAAGL